MHNHSKRRRKILLITLSIIIGLFALLVIFLSPIAKYLLQKYDQKLLGREVTVDWVYINPLTGYAHLNDLKIYENKSDSVFFSSEGLSLRFNLPKLFRGEYQINYLTLSRPVGTVIQSTKDTFNFSDIIQKFSEKPDKPDKDTTQTKFSLLDVKIENGTFYYREKMTPVSYFIKDVNISSSGMRWNADTITNTFDFNSGTGTGKFEGHFKMNTKTSLYKTHIIIRRLDLKIIEQYLKDFSKFGKFRALINLDITADGNMKDARNIDAVGGVGFYDFHFGKNEKEDLASFKKFVVKINHLNPGKKIYEIDSISLVTPFLRYEKYDYLDNIQRMFGVKGSKVKEAAKSEKFNLVIALADYVKLLAKNFFRSAYKVNRIGIYRADIQYHDYSLNEKFALAFNPLTIVADSLGSNKDRAHLHLTSGIKPYGDLKLNLSINPKDSSDFELSYNLEKMNAAVLNPFLLAYTSFPLDRGSIGASGNWRVRNGEINSSNHLVVVDPRLTNKVKAENNKWLPLKLVMFLVREYGNAIDYEIPITGNLKDPKFQIRDVIFDAVSNIFIKPVTTRYRYEIKEIENTIEKNIGFNWEPASADLLDDQEKFVKKVVKFMQDNPGIAIDVYPDYYMEREKEYIGFFEAKKKFFLATGNSNDALSKEDSINVARMSPKDSSFIRYVRKHVHNEMIFTNQQLCREFVGRKVIEEKYRHLNEERKNRFMAYFEDEAVRKRVTWKKPTEGVPFNGFSFYKISYQGDLPENMKEAFSQLNEYDNERPRKKMKEERKKNRRFFKPRGKAQ